MNLKKIDIEEISASDLEVISGGKGNLGSAIGGCIGGVILAAATGPLTGGAAALVCVGSGLSAYL
ncbi:hypothetical protein Si133o_00698 [Streptococcus infantarius subsp. infantarius]|nr:class IIb bacteriocin, lactobin A/cerein 7B family [Streptococcus infantarius]ADF87544.1 infantaricin D precursor [Streptococcus infantarius subsp. infantarius]AHW46160.1 infantaricin C1 [Streptococcus infantarius subsp. infantarius]MCO4466726.1 hypothetical protein [Streptococcus infantarius subsp. infantarius]MCO4483881.1 hypothetical protein [Streptococcus infantarius subsp. infantarius]MCO4627796.1 hypothetical protein [Streptococcus infantarius subsp. infantarius]